MKLQNEMTYGRHVIYPLWRSGLRERRFSPVPTFNLKR